MPGVKLCEAPQRPIKVFLMPFEVVGDSLHPLDDPQKLRLDLADCLFNLFDGMPLVSTYN